MIALSWLGFWAMHCPVSGFRSSSLSLYFSLLLSLLLPQLDPNLIFLFIWLRSINLHVNTLLFSSYIPWVQVIMCHSSLVMNTNSLRWAAYQEYEMRRDVALKSLNLLLFFLLLLYIFTSFISYFFFSFCFSLRHSETDPVGRNGSKKLVTGEGV